MKLSVFQFCSAFFSRLTFRNWNIILLVTVLENIEFLQTFVSCTGIQIDGGSSSISYIWKKLLLCSIFLVLSYLLSLHFYWKLHVHYIFISSSSCYHSFFLTICNEKTRANCKWKNSLYTGQCSFTFYDMSNKTFQ